MFVMAAKFFIEERVRFPSLCKGQVVGSVHVGLRHKPFARPLDLWVVKRSDLVCLPKG